MQDPRKIRPENYINKSSCSIEEAFTKEETPKEEAIAQAERLITKLLLQ